MAHIEAVIVNHDTSLFAQLALRSLLASSEGADITITVVDNHSADDELVNLKGLASDVGAGFERSRWPLAERTVNTHGDVLRDFVLSRPDAELFLFVDSDIDFEEPGSVATMRADLVSDDTLWAVQARFRWTEQNRGEGSSLDIWAGRPVGLRVGHWDDDFGAEPQGFRGRIWPRCHPGCTLVRNTAVFRDVAESIGFSCSVLMSQDRSLAGFLDTFGLASQAMRIAGYRYALSRATVHHFFMASYDTQHVAAREADCRARLARFG